jgi:hypothetical protein
LLQPVLEPLHNRTAVVLMIGETVGALHQAA